MDFDFFVNWLETNQTAVIKVVAIFVVAGLLQRFGRSLVTKFIHRTIRSNRYVSGKAEQQRENTLVQITSGALHILVWPIAVLTALPVFDIEIAPLLAGAGVAGVALGLAHSHWFKIS